MSNADWAQGLYKKLSPEDVERLRGSSDQLVDHLADDPSTGRRRCSGGRYLKNSQVYPYEFCEREVELWSASFKHYAPVDEELPDESIDWDMWRSQRAKCGFDEFHLHNVVDFLHLPTTALL